MHKHLNAALMLAAWMLQSHSLLAQHLVVHMHNTLTGKNMGHIEMTDTPFGLHIRPALHGLNPGMHGTHVHAHASCNHHGKDAGGHLMGKANATHLGPYDTMGHLGDLPALFVDAKHQAHLPVLAPRLTIRDLLGHSIIIHAQGDNYADTPLPLGGGGARVACGIITSALPVKPIAAL